MACSLQYNRWLIAAALTSLSYIPQEAPIEADTIERQIRGAIPVPPNSGRGAVLVMRGWADEFDRLYLTWAFYSHKARQDKS